MSKSRLVLADDHTLIAQAFQSLLEPEFDVVGIFADGLSLVREAPALQPDVIVVDFAMPVLNGLDAFHQLKRILPNAKFIFLTMYEDGDLAYHAMRSGASAFLLKTSAAFELSKAVHEVLRGRSYVTPAIKCKMQNSFMRDPEGSRNSRELTTRQREVLQLLAEGRPMKEAAYILGLTTRTIAFHKYRIMEQFGIANSTELIQFAIEAHAFVPQSHASCAGQSKSSASQNIKTWIGLNSKESNTGERRRRD